MAETLNLKTDEGWSIKARGPSARVRDHASQATPLGLQYVFSFQHDSPQKNNLRERSLQSYALEKAPVLLSNSRKQVQRLEMRDDVH